MSQCPLQAAFGNFSKKAADVTVREEKAGRGVPRREVVQRKWADVAITEGDSSRSPTTDRYDIVPDLNKSQDILSEEG